MILIEASETVRWQWKLSSMMSFDNITVLRTVDNVKYLTCGDCERGIVGFNTVGEREYYVVASKVGYL